jgi:hypothetical protein
VHSNVDHAYYNPLWQTLPPHDKTSSTLIFPKQAILKCRGFSEHDEKSSVVWSIPRKCSNFGIAQDHLKW